MTQQHDTQPPSLKKPLVSIVIPAFNDEAYVARALDTAVGQSLKNIEIICVDDYSTDNTASTVERYAEKDPRVTLLKHSENKSAFQARRTGIAAARAQYILFLDGDDELHKDTAKLSYAQAIASSSDLVGFGSRIIRQDGSSSRDFEKSIQPVYKKLTDNGIVAKLFEPGKPAQGSMWRYLFSKSLLEKAYSYFPEDQSIYRTNDLPISFLSAALAKKYTSIPAKLYTYHYYAGGSGSANFDLDKFKFYTKAIDSLDLLRDIVESKDFRDEARTSYRSARLFVLSNILRQIENNLPTKYHGEAVKFLAEKVAPDEIISAMANFIPEALRTLRGHLPFKTPTLQSKNVALFTNNLNTGGLQGVVMSQASYLQKAGFNVTIILLNGRSISFEVPDDINLELVEKGPTYIRLGSFRSILLKNNIDTVIDHSILYNFTWPFFNLVAKSVKAKTHAWIHSFALRPIVEGTTNGQFLNENINLIDNLAVLSKLDVAYWKSVGHKNVYLMPNPPSPLLLEMSESMAPKKAPNDHLNILWFGRLQQSSKKVYSLIDVAAELKKLTSEFTLTIVGPDSNDLTIRQVKDRVRSKKLEMNIDIVGPKHGDALLEELKRADLYLCTSIIEGYLLTLIEAQSFALPAVMYELPWLSVTEGNDGVTQVPQNDPAIAAQEVYALFTDKKRYEAASKASIEASVSYLSYDFAELYTLFLRNKLPKEFSPEPNMSHMSMLTKWTQFYFAESINGDGSVGSLSAIKLKDAEISALKNSKAMKIGNLAAKPVRLAKEVKHKIAKRFNKV